MELQPPNRLNRFYLSLNKLIIALNAFVLLQRYAIVKRCTKTRKKVLLQKAVLICDKGKEHINKSREKRDTLTRKINCLFDIIAVLEEEG